MIPEKIIKLYQEEKKSIKEIAKIIKCRRGKISKILRENNIPLSNRRGNRFWIYKHQKEIVDLYVQKNKSTIEIANIFKCSLKPIRRILKENNVKMRTDAGHFKFRNKIGALNKNNKLRQQKRKIIKYYEKDMKTIREIANIFNCGTKVISNMLKENNTKTFRNKDKISIEYIRTEFKKGRFLTEIGDDYNVGDWVLRKRLKKYYVKLVYNKLHSKRKSERMRIIRKNIIFPVKDTKIEVKIQNFLKQLEIEFFPHQYMKIEHGYQCDIFIPSINLILETDGDYWHGNKEMFDDEKLTERIIKQRELDKIRTQELLEKGHNVIRIWENDINKMSLNDFKNRLSIYKIQNKIL